MTNQEAIKILQNVLTVNQKEAEAVGMLVKALKELDKNCTGCKWEAVSDDWFDACKGCSRNALDNYEAEGEEDGEK